MDHNSIDKLSRALAGSTSRRGTLKLLGGGIAGGLVLATGHREATAQGGTLEIPIDFTSDSGSFAGTFTVNRFLKRNGKVVAIGTLTGTVKDAAGDTVGTVEQALRLPVLGSSNGTCDILHLELGPLDLDLLGLIVHLDKVVLDIDADPSGGLLGQLLCAIADLLDGGGHLRRLARLLNLLLGALDV
jgi:hypothetical protein